jgi:AcrR family transcriptional regulator
MRKAPKPSIVARKRPRQARSNQLVEDILEAAVRVLTRHGARRFTTVRVAEEAGVSVGSLYQYFPNKESLLYRLQTDEWTETWAVLDEILFDTRLPPLDRLRRAVLTFFRSERQEAGLRVALDDAGALFRDAPEARAHIAIGDETRVLVSPGTPAERDAPRARVRRGRRDDLDVGRRRDDHCARSLARRGRRVGEGGFGDVLRVSRGPRAAEEEARLSVTCRDARSIHGGDRRRADRWPRRSRRRDRRRLVLGQRIGDLEPACLRADEGMERRPHARVAVDGSKSDVRPAEVPSEREEARSAHPAKAAIDPRRGGVPREGLFARRDPQGTDGHAHDAPEGGPVPLPAPGAVAVEGQTRLRGLVSNRSAQATAGDHRGRERRRARERRAFRGEAGLVRVHGAPF